MDNKQSYHTIPIPEELPQRVEQAIQAARRPRSRRPFRYAAGIAAAAFASFAVLLNASPVFAQTMGDLPVVGGLFRIFTLREYHVSDELRFIDARIPQIDSTGLPELEARVNLEISHIIQEELDKADQRAAEYYEAFVATGGDPDDFRPIGITIDYEVKSVTDSYASFVVWKFESLASSYTEYYFYNMDLETGQLLTLRGLLGPDYREIAAQAVETGKASLPDDKKQMLFDDIDPIQLIDDDTDFYITPEGEIVLVFEKYTLAAGAASSLEFPIPDVRVPIE